jgi:hypothetical protein
MTEDDVDHGNISLGCYRSEDEAKKAKAYWDEGDYSYQWIVEHDLYSKFKESDLMK